MAKKKRILVFSNSPEGFNPGQRLKYEQYYAFLREQGYDIVPTSFQTIRFWNIIYKPGRIPEKIFWTFFGYLKRAYDILRAPFYDGVYVFLWVTPFGFPISEWLLTLMNKNLVFDLDDMVFLGHKSEANSFIARFKGKKKMIYLMKRAKYVIVCTPKLEEVARNYNDKVIDISSTFNTERFLPIPSYESRETTTIGWTGSHSTLKFLHLLDDVLKEVAQKRKIKLRVIADKEFELDGVEVENINWTEEKEVEDLHGIEIGLYPIPMNEWSLGKSGCKTITYQSVAIPSVSTAFGTNFRIVEHGENGFLAKDHNEWVKYLIQLIDDIDLRKKLGENGRENVLENFSVNANKEKYLKVFKAVYG